MRDNLPSFLQAYDRLCATGEQFPDAEHYTVDTGLTFEHHSGPRPILIDQRALRASGVVYTNDYHLWSALHQHGVYTDASVNLLNTLQTHFEDMSSLIWGLSGYASVLPGVSYDKEGEGINALYETLLTKGYPPSLVVDGGVREGCLGLNGVIAKLKRISSLGIIPIKGLANVGIRDLTAVCGKTYQDREEHVGTIPDVLVCVGGDGLRSDGTKGGTLRECEYAIANGSVVLLLKLRDYSPTSLPGSYRRLSHLVEAEVNGRLFVCEKLSDIPLYIERVLRAIWETLVFSRGQRQPKLAHLLNT
ncbi:MAG TPA: hypothetical protein VFT59_04940 [Candidatus Saccharimonadales bacterium]|nr:hypothetical protein [Candidatus Saccharimonadales bacterium]